MNYKITLLQVIEAVRVRNMETTMASDRFQMKFINENWIEVTEKDNVTLIPATNIRFVRVEHGPKQHSYSASRRSPAKSRAKAPAPATPVPAAS